MAKDDWRNLLLRNPDEAWKSAGRKPKDMTPKRREKLVAAIQNTIKQLQAGEEAPRRGWYTTKGELVRVTVKAGNKIIPVAGREYNVVPKDRALDFYNGVLAAAKAGQLDADMNATYDAGGTGAKKSGGSRGGWSPARRAAFEAAKKK